jgi:hypothetical protein
MYSVRTLMADVSVTSFLGNPDSNENEVDPTDVWLFTDPAAKAYYAREGKLARLEQDIRTYVMFNGRWGPDELDFKREIDRLTYLNILVPRSAFGHLSPHPTIYQAIREGRIQVIDEHFHFRIGDDIVFEPWIARLSHPGLVGPLRIGRLDTTARYSLCCEEFPQIKELLEGDLKILHNIFFSS